MGGPPFLRVSGVLLILRRHTRQRPEEIDGVGGQEGKKVRDYSECLAFIISGVKLTMRVQSISAVDHWTRRDGLERMRVPRRRALLGDRASADDRLQELMMSEMRAQARRAVPTQILCFSSESHLTVD